MESSLQSTAPAPVSDVAVPWGREQELVYRRYILWFVYACMIYSIIGFSWGAIMGGVPGIRHFVDQRLHGDLIVRAHTHINLLGWVEMAIFAGVYYIIPRLVKSTIYSLKLVKVHFWTHNVGLLGMVIMFSAAGVIGGRASETLPPVQVEQHVSQMLAFVGLFGSLVLLANIIWAYNIFRTCAGWVKNQ